MQSQKHALATHQIQGAVYACLLALNWCCHEDLFENGNCCPPKKGRLGSTTCGYEAQELWESFFWPQRCTCPTPELGELAGLHTALEKNIPSKEVP